MKIKIILLLFLQIFSKNNPGILGKSFNNASLNPRNETIFADSLPDIDDVSFFYTPIEFTPKGTRCFFTHIFDNDKYVTDFLPYNLTHLKQFLDYEKREIKSSSFAVMILRTFNNKLRSIKLIDAQECYHFLYDLPNLLAHHVSQNFEPVSSIIHDRINTDDYEQVKRWRNNVWLDLNQSLELINQREKMIEILISKVMWIPKDSEKCWQLFKEIYSQIDNIFMNQKAVGYDISWVLIYRFIDFIDLFGSELPVVVYERALQDLNEGRIRFNNHQEVALGVKTQETLLKRALLDGKFNAENRQNFGIITQDITPLSGGYINQAVPVQIIESVS